MFPFQNEMFTDLSASFERGVIRNIRVLQKDMMEVLFCITTAITLTFPQILKLFLVWTRVPRMAYLA